MLVYALFDPAHGGIVFFTTIGEHLNRKLSRDTKKKKKEKEEETARFYYFIFLSKSRTPAKNMLYCFVKTY